MSNHGIDLVSSGPPAPEPPRRGGSRRGPAKPRRGLGVAVLLILIAMVVGGGYYGLGKVQSMFSGPSDYQGQGSGAVTVEIPEGANGLDIARVLADNDVVASADAFYQLSLVDERAQLIQPGFYGLAQRMSAEAALTALSDKANRVENTVTIPEGARLDQVISLVSDSSDISADDLTAALKEPSGLGLPPEADNNAEGYLYPATYTVAPGTTATQLLTEMVSKTKEIESELNMAQRAAELGYTTEQILTVASILEYEAKQDQDYPKVARVLYNRLAIDMPLQLDSTVSYVSGRKGDVWTTEDERNAESAYNTYQNAGLPPGPIGSPGRKTIEAALNPVAGSWLYFVAVDLATGETKFADTYAEHERNAEEAREYCRNSDIC